MNSNSILHDNLPLIEVTEKYILDTLMADAITRQYIVNRLSDTVAVISPAYVEALLTRLRKQGHLPRLIRPSH